MADAAGSTGMVGGQAIDLQAAGQTRGSPLTLDANGLRAMHAKKTGAMIRASAVAGAVMAGADEALVKAVDDYASEIGLAFQIVDDVLDVEGNAHDLGKTAGKDAAEEKPTYASLYGVARSREIAADCIARARRALSSAGLDREPSRRDRGVGRGAQELGRVTVGVSKTRLDVLLVERGLAPSRERARALILAGHVTVNGQRLSKAGTPVAADARVDLAVPDHPYASRGGLKLVGALDAFGLDPTGRRALDIGASTGGFTDVLLQRGATSVIALDVGHGQLDWRLRSDPRVVIRDGVNARALSPDDLPYAPDLVTIDVAFISLRHILPPLPPLLAARADVIALVKPQFEAGRDEVGKHGLVTDPAIHDAVLARVTETARLAGFERARDGTSCDHRRHGQSGILPAPAQNDSLVCFVIG